MNKIKKFGYYEFITRNFIAQEYFLCLLKFSKDKKERRKYLKYKWYYKNLKYIIS